eukprot:364891-Chlamydomonas_euryale.AAC.4
MAARRGAGIGLARWLLQPSSSAGASGRKKLAEACHPAMPERPRFLLHASSAVASNARLEPRCGLTCLAGWPIPWLKGTCGVGKSEAVVTWAWVGQP